MSLHLIQRGNNRSACFYAAEDYLFYLDVLAEQAKKHGCAVHAWCLMTNHVHLLVTPQSPESTGLMMKGLGQRYVQYINRTYRVAVRFGKVAFAPAWCRRKLTCSVAIDILK
ncbi:transposase [Pseudomonas sp. MEJ086]|nr:transposase [Pseudomonas sp. MEJ086]